MSKPGGIVRIKNVSDFVEPSQKCILPLRQNGEGQKAVVGKRLVGIHAKSVPSAATAKRVKVTLDDCLVCSGCVTTGEVEFF
ncbi:hypothetical protein niasHS_006913 [Heterodera schachtii]|uniref:Uncharacterized protein n=2 Tax=Heterodera TaxID=34509 RepID=A0ABD2JG64_HETSC